MTYEKMNLVMFQGTKNDVRAFLHVWLFHPNGVWKPNTYFWIRTGSHMGLSSAIITFDLW